VGRGLEGAVLFFVSRVGLSRIRGRVGLLAFVVALVCGSGFVAQARAATFTVGTTQDSTAAGCVPASGTCSLRQLIGYENGLTAAPSPSDTIAVPAGSYALTNGALAIQQSVSIGGAGARVVTVEQSSSTPDRVFDVQLTAGGGVPTVSISGMAIEFGTANSNNGFFGGDVRSRGDLTLSEDWVTSGNASSGGGISNYGGTLTVSHSLVSGNAASSGGGDSGGIQNYGDNSVGAGNLTVDNSTIAHNAASLGGGIFSWCGSSGTNPCATSGANNTTTVTNSTIAFNDGGSRSTNGGGLLAGAGPVSVENSIVALNTVSNPSAGTASNCGGSGITSLGHNLESGSDCGFTAPGDLQSTDPQFTSTFAGDNGANTDTLAIDATSPAVDAIPAGAAGCGGADQRDISRPQGTGCDIGAVELLQPVEGQPAQMHFLAASCSLSGTVTIDWGDGTSSTSNSFVATHAYPEERLYTGSVSYTDDCGPHVVPFDVKVQDAPLTATATAARATAAQAFTGPLATLSDGNSGAGVSDFSATVSWGDGQSSAGTISASGGQFTVTATHTYAAQGSYPTTVTIRDVGGASSTVHGTATVSAGPSKPLVASAKPVVKGSSQAGFAGLVNPEGRSTNAHFIYGLDASDRGPGFSGTIYDQSTPAQAIGSDFSAHALSSSVANLVPNAMYHVRLVASNSAGTTTGPDQTFTTPKAPAPPAPVLGKNENFIPVGTVFVLVNGHFIKLTQARQLPSGTEVDALHGSLNLAAATGKKGTKYTGSFGGAVFKVIQTRTGANKGLTTLSILEGAFQGAPSYASCKAKGAADRSLLAHAAVSSRILQALRSRANGRFRTRGRYAAATVRGTQWTTTDRCDGTLIGVQLHAVLVNDFIKHITILIHSGHSYLAKASKHK
jgi:hypothetical protein